MYDGSISWLKCSSYDPPLCRLEIQDGWHHRTRFII